MLVSAVDEAIHKPYLCFVHCRCDLSLSLYQQLVHFESLLLCFSVHPLIGAHSLNLVLGTFCHQAMSDIALHLGQ